MQCICDQGNKGTGRTSAVVSMGAPELLPADSEVGGPGGRGGATTSADQTGRSEEPEQNRSSRDQIQCICDRGNKSTGRTSAVVSMGAPTPQPAAAGRRWVGGAGGDARSRHAHHSRHGRHARCR